MSGAIGVSSTVVGLVLDLVLPPVAPLAPGVTIVDFSNSLNHVEYSR